MNHQQQNPQKLLAAPGRVPKQEVYQQVQQQGPVRMRAPATYIQQPPQQQRIAQQNSNGMTRSTANRQQQQNQYQQGVSIEEVPNAQSFDNANTSNNSQPRLDEEKLPLFLIKLWNIVQDQTIQSIVHWDESGASFHIADPYSFCRNVLPHYFKHNNLNSLIRQLNMYGFRKMTPLNQGGLTRTESDQDHLEFSHPFFVQSHPEYMVNIKRKQSTRADDKQITVQTQNNIEMVMQEVRSLRDKQRTMENKMNTLNKENRQLWDQMSTMRHQHSRQQQVVKKLFQFLVSMVQPSLPNRNLKRGVLAIDDHGGPSNSKRPRQDSNSGGGAQNTAGLNSTQLSEMLESLQRELQDGDYVRRFSNDQGPVIAEVTDELGHSPPSSSRPYGSNFDDFADEPEDFDVPIVSNFSNSSNSSFNRAAPNRNLANSQNVYMGSGALTAENVGRTPSPNDLNNRKQPKRSSSRQQTGYPTAPTFHQPQNQLTYQYPPNEQMQNNQLVQLTPKKTGGAGGGGEQDDLNSTNNYDRQDTFSPTLVMSPSLERQISQELQDYLNGVDFTIDNCRDLLTDWADFDQPMNDLDVDYTKYGEPSSSMTGETQQRLALEHIPISEDVEEKSAASSVQPSSLSVPTSAQRNNAFYTPPFPDPSFPTIPDQMNLDQFPGTPELLTPGASPSARE